jgi:hypothetical protein
MDLVARADRFLISNSFSSLSRLPDAGFENGWWIVTALWRVTEPHKAVSEIACFCGVFLAFDGPCQSTEMVGCKIGRQSCSR